MQHLPKSIKRIWFMMSIIHLIVNLLILGTYLLAQHLWWPWLPEWGIVFWVVLSLVIFVVELALIPYRYAVYQYAVYPTEVEIKKGFFWRRFSAIPIARVQNVDLQQGPLLRFQQLYRITVATGGSNHTIEALSHEQAVTLKDQVMTLAREARNDQ